MKTLTIITGLLIVTLLVTGLAIIPNENDKISAENVEYDIEVEITGLHCSMCEANCRRSLERLDQIEEATVKRDDGLAFIKLKPGQTVTKGHIIEAIEDAGYEAGEFKKFPENDQTSQE